MRIVYVANSAVPSRAANSVHVMKMCAALGRNGHDVTLILPWRRDIMGGITDVYGHYGVTRSFRLFRLPLLPVFGSGRFFGFLGGHVAKVLRPNLVYGRDVFSCACASRLGLPTAVELHTAWEDYATYAQQALTGLLASQALERVVVITHALASAFLERFPELQQRLLVVPDAADIPPDNVPACDLDSNYAMHVGYVGSLFPGRGIEIIVRMAQANPTFCFHLIGDARQLVNPVQLENLIYHGYFPPASLHAWRAAMDVLVAPYQWDVRVYGMGRTNTARWMSPLKIFEYMAAGKGILCSDLPVLHEVLKHEETCLFCAAEDISAWNAGLQRLQNREYRQALGNRAREVFLNHYTWDARARHAVAELPTGHNRRG